MFTVAAPQQKKGEGGGFGMVEEGGGNPPPAVTATTTGKAGGASLCLGLYRTHSLASLLLLSPLLSSAMPWACCAGFGTMLHG